MQEKDPYGADVTVTRFDSRAQPIVRGAGGVEYVTDRHGTVRRRFPKLRGKRAREEAREARRRAKHPRDQGGY